MNATLTATDTQLTAADRCDRCGAQAYILVNLSNGGELMFCRHHGREHHEKLAAMAASIHDESIKLEKTRTSAPAEER